MLKIAAIVPAFNEEKSISAVIDEINALTLGDNLSIDAIVINDCSQDNTGQIIAKLDCIAISLPINLGIGGAVQTGFKYAYEHNYDFAVQIDGDGQHPPTEIPKLLNELIKKDLDVVIGSRFIYRRGFQSTFMRRIGIKYFELLNKIFIGQQITDSTSGLRIINRKTLAIVNNYYPDEYPEPESIILYAVNSLKIGEVAVEMRERQAGVSSISTAHSIYYMIKVTLAMFFTFIRLKQSRG